MVALLGNVLSLMTVRDIRCTRIRRPAVPWLCKALARLTQLHSCSPPSSSPRLPCDPAARGMAGAAREQLAIAPQGWLGPRGQQACRTLSCVKKRIPHMISYSIKSMFYTTCIQYIRSVKKVFYAVRAKAVGRPQGGHLRSYALTVAVSAHGVLCWQSW